MMTKLNLMKSTLVAACAALFSFSLSAQVVKNDRLLSFEQPELPAGLSATKATLGISDQHYKDGTHSLRWKRPVPFRLYCLGVQRKSPEYYY